MFDSELDGRIAEMMGYTLSKDGSFMGRPNKKGNLAGVWTEDVPRYSGNLLDAWRVVTFMEENGYYLTLDKNRYDHDDGPMWYAHFCKEHQYAGCFTDDACEAICVAALDAWNGKS